MAGQEDNMKKKMAAAVLTLAMTGGVLAGCGENAEQSGGSSAEKSGGGYNHH